MLCTLNFEYGCSIENIQLALAGLHCCRAFYSLPGLSDEERPTNAPRMVGRLTRNSRLAEGC
jgi:hypothetical protein